MGRAAAIFAAWAAGFALTWRFFYNATRDEMPSPEDKP